MKLSLSFKNVLLYSILLMLPMFFTNCSDDDNDLNGTVWEGIDKQSNYEYKVTIHFHKNTFTEVITETYTNGTNYTDEYKGTYEYDSPRVILTDEDGDVEHAIITDNRLVFTYDDGDDDESIIFYKIK